MIAETTDLMYAAYLISLGATVEHTEPCGRYTKLYVKVPKYSLTQNADKSARLDRLSKRAEHVEELSHIYEQSIMSDVAMHYYALKKRIARQK
jgi:hypothetical protein